MLSLSDIEKKILLAKSESSKHEIYAISHAGIWRFYFNDKVDKLACGVIGEVYKTKSSLLNDAFNYITLRSGYGELFRNGFTDIVKELKPVYISKDEIESLGRIIDLLSQDENLCMNKDIYHLKNLLKKC